MIAAEKLALVVLALASAAVGGSACLRLSWMRHAALKAKANAILHQSALRGASLGGVSHTGALQGEGDEFGSPDTNGVKTRWRGLSLAVVEYAQRLSSAFAYRAYAPLFPLAKSGSLFYERNAAFLKKHAVKAGLRKSVTPEGLTEASLRFLAVGALVGVLVGCFLSPEVALILALVGSACGYRLPARSILRIKADRAAVAAQKTSEMLEVVALGLRSGLTFDRSFEVYAAHFDSPFARDCAAAGKSWTLGLASREEALCGLADSYDCEELSHAVGNIVRSLRFGASIASDLEEMAAQSREGYRAVVAERIAKAPVKMMLPTGTLILPAMLLLVLGPVFIELAQGF